MVANAQVQDIEKEIIIVDDASTDGTCQILQSLNLSKYGARLYLHKCNYGKGAALRTAQKHINGDIVLIQDADLEYDPKDYVKLVTPILDGSADVVYGSRLVGGTSTHPFPFFHYLGNKILSLLANVLYDCNLTDIQTCYKAFRADIFKELKIKSNRFDFDPEVTAKVLKRQIKIYEIPISYHRRDYNEGKKITWKDGFLAIWKLISYKFIAE